MKLFTLIENQKKLESAEIEIQMIPGIPQIHFLGLPDQAIKESFLRIKSALKVCSFRFPTNQQIIVNIKPNHLKKSSKGLELAVALGILHVTGQKILTLELMNSVIYGELSLDGEVNEPNDLTDFKTKHPEVKILSGKDNFKRNQIEFRIPHLAEKFEYIQNPISKPPIQRPTAGLDLSYTLDEAEILFLFATSKMHLLLSGPAGFGKTTLAKHSVSFAKIPTLIAPHSSVTPGAFLGGGAQLFQGEIENVQNGILFLDEFLEFNPEIIETLRGPMTGEKLRLSRSGNVREFNCDFQVIGTTNLCPCGKWTPEVKIRNCRFANKKCQSHLERLSGPILDRFGIYYFYPQKNQKRTIPGNEILNRIESFNKKKKILGKNSATSLVEQMYADISFRRKNSLLQAAEIYAIERESSSVELVDLIKAEKWTYNSFLLLEQGMS